MSIITTIQRFRSIGLLVTLAGCAISPAMAVNVSYSTVGSFASGGGTTNFSPISTLYLDSNGLQISFTGVTAPFNTVAVPPTSAVPMGYMLLTGPAVSPDTVTDSFTLKISQTTPTTAGPQVLTDSLSGTITGNNSGVTVTFNPGGGAVLTTNPLTSIAAISFNFGPVTYWVDQTTQLNPQSTGSPLFGGAALTELQGAIGANSLPEPAFYSLIGVGFAGLMLMAVRRSRQGSAS